MSRQRNRRKKDLRLLRKRLDLFWPLEPGERRRVLEIFKRS